MRHPIDVHRIEANDNGKDRVGRKEAKANQIEKWFNQLMNRNKLMCSTEYGVRCAVHVSNRTTEHGFN